MDETSTAATPEVVPSTTAATPDVEPSTTTPASPQGPVDPVVATPQPQARTPIEVECAAALASVAPGERADVVIDGQTYVAWLGDGFALQIENRGI